MRRVFVLIAVMLIIAATVRAIFPSGTMSVTLTVVQLPNRWDKTMRVQKIVGHMPEAVNEEAPSLGRLLAIRPNKGAPNVYTVEATRNLHVYIIGESSDPQVFTFEPGRFGHASRYEIALEELGDT